MVPRPRLHPRGRRVRSPGTAGPRDTAISTSNGAPGPLEPAPEARMTPQFALLTPRFRPFVASCCLRCCDERTQAVRHNSHNPWRHCYRTQRFQKACTRSSLHPSHRYSLMVPIFSINLPVRALHGRSAALYVPSRCLGRAHSSRQLVGWV